MTLEQSTIEVHDRGALIDEAIGKRGADFAFRSAFRTDFASDGGAFSREPRRLASIIEVRSMKRSTIEVLPCTSIASIK